uniref:Uncharacterized protein n=1 Tax=Tanacetum cinerariifolium TaxID=118510 RepID=A0A699I3Z9_TANCI|nr:hypothetical protein [Tanacetum cinerariifolium]GEZ04804.1 hypothetical protein [Tanacetum cinerariifolium]
MSYEEAKEEESKTESEPAIMLTGSLVESPRKKQLKKFDFDTEESDHVHLRAEQIKEQKWIEEMALKNITSCDILSRGKSLITLKIQTRMENLQKNEQELEFDFTKPLGEQDPIIKLNDLARKKINHVDDIHDYFRSTKRYKSSVQYEDHLTRTVLNEPCLGPGQDDHARTFSSFLLAEVDKRGLNLLKQMRAIEQPRLFVYSNKGRLLGQFISPSVSQ